MKSILSSDQDYKLWVLLYQTRDALLKARKQELKRYGISPMRTAVLFVIQAIGNKATPAEISRWLFREPNSVSEILSRMEKAGLVRKVRDLGRNNSVRVAITEKGQQALYQATKTESIHRIVSSLSEEERQQLRSLLKTLRNEALNELKLSVKAPFP